MHKGIGYDVNDEFIDDTEAVYYLNCIFYFFSTISLFPLQWTQPKEVFM